MLAYALRQPQILMSSLELKIKPCLGFLFTRLHLTPQQARMLTCADVCSRVLTYADVC
jgi:hypothetical protein